MKKILNAWPLLMLFLLLTSCEVEEEENPPGYVISTLFEVNGKKRTDRTGEVTSCRMEDKWVFDLPRKQVTSNYIQGSCTGFTRKNGLLTPCDTLYVDSLQGRYLTLEFVPVFGLNPPIVHPDFPMELLRSQVTELNKSYTLFFRMTKFNQKELIILNKFNPKLIPRDSQYFELTMKYVEQ
jgi:hypothetical protein